MILAEALLTIIVWANWTDVQGVAALTYPLYALQSVLFASAIECDARYQRPEVVQSARDVWEACFIWVVVSVLVISTLFAASQSGTIPLWLQAALYVSGILYLVLCLNDHWRSPTPPRAGAGA